MTHLLVVLMACGETELLQTEPAPDVVRTEVVDGRPAQMPRFAQDELEGWDDVVTLSGELLCTKPGPFEIRVFPGQANSNRAPNSHPGWGHLAAVRLEQPGPFSVHAPIGPGRILLGFADHNQDGRASLDELPFFPMGQGAGVDLDADVSDIVLDCAIPLKAAGTTASVASIEAIGTRGARAKAVEDGRVDEDGRALGEVVEYNRRPNSMKDILNEADRLGIEDREMHLIDGKLVGVEHELPVD